MKPKPLLALGVLFVGVTAAASLTAPQNPATSQSAEQQKLKERVEALESQLKEAQAKAEKLDSNIKAAAIEKDYVERIQKEVNAYYEKAFNTQLATVTIIALIVGLIGKFGVDHIVQSKLTEASATLREEFTKKLDDKFVELEKSHADRLKQVEDDFKHRSEWQLLFLQGMTYFTDGRHDETVDSLRRALAHYKSGKPRNVVEKRDGVISIYNLFNSLQRSTGIGDIDRDTHALEELKSELYQGLEDELAQAALQLPWLVSLLRKKKNAAPPAQPATPAAAPPTAQESATTAPDKDRGTKP